MYDRHHDFCRRNFVDPQQVWNEAVSWCWDAVVQRWPCLGHTCHLFDFKCRVVPMKSIGLFTCLKFSACWVSCWSRAWLGSGTSHISAFHPEPHAPTKPLTRLCCDGFYLEYLRHHWDQIDSNTSVLNNNMHMTPLGILSSLGMCYGVQYKTGFGKTSCQIVQVNHVKHVPFPFATSQAYNVWKCCTFSETEVM